MTRRTKILLLLALLASIPFGLQLWRSTLRCKTVEVPVAGGFQAVVVPDTTGFGTMPCPVEDPSKLSTSIVVLTWITFCSAAACFGTIDAADYFAALRRGDGEDAWMKG